VSGSRTPSNIKSALPARGANREQLQDLGIRGADTRGYRGAGGHGYCKLNWLIDSCLGNEPVLSAGCLECTDRHAVNRRGGPQPLLGCRLCRCWARRIAAARLLLDSLRP